MSNINYFPSISSIWTAYFNKKIGLDTRNQLLKPYRDQLYKEDVNNPHSQPPKPTKIKTKSISSSDLAKMTADWYGCSVEDLKS